MLPLLVVHSSDRTRTVLYIINADISLLRLDNIQHSLHIDKAMAQILTSLEDPLARLFLLLTDHGIQSVQMIATIEHL